jgi:hypothetical protein
MIKFWWDLLVQLNCCFQNLEVLFKYDVKCLFSRSTQNRPSFWVGSCCSFVKLHIAILFPLCDVCYDFCVTRRSPRLCFRVFVRRYIFICLREFYIKCWLCRLKMNTDTGQVWKYPRRNRQRWIDNVMVKWKRTRKQHMTPNTGN